MADPDIAETLQTQSFFPDRDGHPQCALIIFKPIAGNPGCTPGELNVVEDNQNITAAYPGKKTPVGGKIGSADGDNHDLFKACGRRLDVRCGYHQSL